MKTFFLGLMMALATFVPAMAADNGHSQGEAWLKPIEAQYVCMMNNKVFDKPQMVIEVAGKTYYGCCPMCKDMLEKDAAERSAIDPVSGKAVDKAAAIIGADSEGNAYYFENQDNLKKFSSGPKPEKKPDAGMDGMSMPNYNHIRPHTSLGYKPPAPLTRMGVPMKEGAFAYAPAPSFMPPSGQKDSLKPWTQ